MRKSLLLITLSVVAGLGTHWLGAQGVESDGPGNLRSITSGGRRIPITSELVMPVKGWSRSAHSRWNATPTEYISYTDGTETWRGRASAGSSGPTFDYTQSRRLEGSRIRFQIQVTSRTSLDIEGVFLFINFPIAWFAGGEATLLRGTATAAASPLPAEFNQVTYLAGASGDSFVLHDADQVYRFAAELPRPFPLTLQDNRTWGTATYSVFFPLHSGNLASGQTTSLDFTLELTGQAPAEAMTLTVDAAGTREYFDGWGGNFVFNTTSPETDWLLSQLRVSWARTGIDLGQWEPVNDNGSAAVTDWTFFNGRINFSTQVRQDFEIARKLKERDIPLIVSVWYVPLWMQPGGRGAKIPTGQWNEFLESIGAWLITARDRYGFEPDYFSFNEPDIGVYVLQTPEEHRDAVRSIGEYFEAKGLKTRLLGGDCANASNPGYVAPLAGDPDALRHVGPLAYHTWNGATPDQYRGWRQAARDLGRPLLATEVGSDPAAWNYPAIFWTYGYALDDLANYFGFLHYSRPQAALQWELTSDYPLARRNQDGSFTPSKRFWFVKHLADLTPPRAEYLDSTSPDFDDVAILAFRGSTSGSAEAGPRVPDSMVIHLANFGPARQVEIAGIPPDVTHFQVFRTSSSEDMSALPAVATAGASVSLELAEQSLTTLVGEVLPESLHFAHFAQGLGLLSSRVILLNPHPDRTVEARVRFRADEGHGLPIPWTDGTEAAEVTVGIPPLGLRSLDSALSGPLSAGSARVSADGPLSGTILFGGSTGLAAVAPGMPQSAPFQVPIDVDREQGVNTGLALAETGGRPARIVLQLLSAQGQSLAAAEVLLPPLGHLARFAPEFNWTPVVDLDGFTGSIRGVPDAPVAATVLQSRPGQLLTLPVGAEGSGGDAFYFAQFGEGAGLLQSRILLLNPQSDGAQGTLRFRSGAGTPLQVDLNGVGIEGESGFSVPAFGLASFATDGLGPVQSGSVEVEVDQGLEGVLLFTGAVGAAGVGATPELAGGFLLPLETASASGINTGFAIHNLADTGTRVRYLLRDPEGVLLSEAALTLPGRGQDARFVTELDWAPAVDLAAFTGVLEVRPDAPVTAVGLLAGPEQLATLPVARVLPAQVR